MVDTQLIAHDMEVHDIAWGGVGVFATASADGSVRVFDLRWGTSCCVSCCAVNAVCFDLRCSMLRCCAVLG